MDSEAFDRLFELFAAFLSLLERGELRMTAPRRRKGSVELATLRSLERLDEISPVHDALAATALSLAQTIDAGAGAGMSVAAVARELRATLTALADAGGDDGDADLAALTSELLAGDMPPAVVNSAH